MSKVRKNDRPEPWDSKGKKPETERPAVPEVVYTQPQALDPKKLILRLVSVAAVVLALFVGFSLFFRVDTIIVTGADQYTREMIVEASGIEKGDSLLFFGEAKACAKIAEELHYVKNVRISIQLPGTVKIHIEEVQATYAAQDQSGSWWLMASDSRIMEKTSVADAAKHTVIKGIRLLSPTSGSKAQVVEVEPVETDENDEIVEVDYTNAQRLEAALKIISRLEYRNILDGASVVDVTDMDQIIMWYGDRFQVMMGDSEGLDHKVDTVVAAIDELDSHDSGVLTVVYGIPPQTSETEEEPVEKEVWYVEYVPAD